MPKAAKKIAFLNKLTLNGHLGSKIQVVIASKTVIYENFNRDLLKMTFLHIQNLSPHSFSIQSRST